jgi:branched-chain amino acid transport system ATP-binding protein
MLRIDDLSVAYGPVQAVRKCSIEVPHGSIVTLLGANGAGKSTLLNTVAGFVRPRRGAVLFDGRAVTGWAPDRLVRAGLSLVPEHRQLFPEMTVDENLLMGRYVHGFGASSRRTTEEVFELFPELAEKRSTAAGMLSGGQQQMLAMGRGLMAKPRLLLLDEPSLGLAPRMIDRILDAIEAINKAGVTILLVEQNAYKTLPLSLYSYVLENGVVAVEGPSRDLIADPKIAESYLGTI